VYVGDLCIILRRQKHTSRYIRITPLLVKLAYFLPPKKIWCDTYVSFFGKNQVCARAELRRGTQRAESELFLLCFQNFFFVSSVFRALAAVREQSRALLFHKMACAKPAACRALLFCKLPHNICAREACCSQSSPLLHYHVISSNILQSSVRAKPAARRALLFQPLTQTTHSSEGLSFRNPLWQNPKSSP